MLATAGTDPLEHLEVIGAGRPIVRPGLPCVAVPTTAGTGSEVTRNSVLSGGGVKASLRSPLLLPKVAVVDPDLLVGLPGPTIAASGMDALSQLIEPLLSRRANPFSDALARDGIRRSARSLRRAWQEGMEDAGVREDLALASLFGGLCLANSGLGAVHGLAAAAGARLSAPHGAVCAAVLAATMEVNLRALRDRAPEHPALPRMAEVAALLTGQPEATPEDAIGWLHELTAALSIPGLASYGLDRGRHPGGGHGRSAGQQHGGQSDRAERRRSQRDRHSLAVTSPPGSAPLLPGADPERLRSAGSAVGGAQHQMGGKDPLFGRSHRSAEGIGQLLDDSDAHVIERHANGGEGEYRPTGDGKIVEADQCHIVGDGDPELVSEVDRSDRHMIIGAEHRLRSGPFGHQRFHPGIADLVVEPPPPKVPLG